MRRPVKIHDALTPPTPNQLTKVSNNCTLVSDDEHGSILAWQFTMAGKRGGGDGGGG